MGEHAWKSYHGLFKENKKNGIGYLSFANGSIFLGEFVDDKANGLGIFYFTDGNKCSGEWAENKLKSLF